MRAVWIDVPAEFLAARHQLGHDKLDEIWEGELHMVPPASGPHGRRGSDLVFALASIAKRRGLVFYADGTGIFDARAAELSYRIPDASLARPEHESARGLEGAELVVEMLSPHDEARAKFPFYARVGVREIWLIEPHARAIELHALGDRGYVRVASADALRSPLLGITIERVELADGAKLRLRDGDHVEDV